MEFDDKKIVTKEYFDNINKAKLKKIKRIAKILEVYSNSNNPQIESQVKYIADNIYPFLNKTEKQILASNTFLSDDKKIINALLEGGIGYNTLCYYSNFISKLKKTTLKNKLEINDEISVDMGIALYIHSIISSNLGVSDFNLIATKLNEIVATKKSLYMKKQKNKKHIIKQNSRVKSL